MAMHNVCTCIICIHRAAKLRARHRDQLCKIVKQICGMTVLWAWTPVIIVIIIGGPLIFNRDISSALRRQFYARGPVRSIPVDLGTSFNKNTIMPYLLALLCLLALLTYILIIPARPGGHFGPPN